MPFVQMMLSMMVAMGLIERFPANARHGNFAWSGLSDPYTRALTIQGLPPGANNHGFVNNPFVRSPWLQSPWTSSAMDNANVNSASPIWGTPSWGVLPMDKYSVNNYDPYGSSIWSESDLDGWVNEPWETSQWNPDAVLRESMPVQAAPPEVAQTHVPVATNFSDNMSAEERHNEPQVRRQQSSDRQPGKSPSPLSKLMQADSSLRQLPAQQMRPPARELVPVVAMQKSVAQQRAAMQNAGQKLCVTDFCGLKAPNLNGLWVAQNGEMLGVKNKRYLWSDGKTRHLTGQLLIQNEYLLTSVDGHEKIMRFKYKLAGNHLLTMQPDGTIREFVRMPNKQNFSQMH